MRDPEAKAYVRTLVLAALLGVPVAFAAVLFQTAIHDVIHLVWDVIPDELGWSEPAWWYVILVPGLAGLLVAAAVRLPGHGGHSPLEGLGADPIPPIALASILPAALATLGLGLVLGPEAPLIALGLGLGALAVRLIRLEGTGAQLLVVRRCVRGGRRALRRPVDRSVSPVRGDGGEREDPRAADRARAPAGVRRRRDRSGRLHRGRGLGRAAPDEPRAPVATSVRDPASHRPGLVPGHGRRRRRARRRDSPPGASHRRAVALGPGWIAGRRRAPRRRAGGRVSCDSPTGPSTSSSSRVRPSCRTVVAEGSAGVLVLLVVAKGLAYALSLGAGFRGGPVFPAIAIGVAAANGRRRRPPRAGHDAGGRRRDRCRDDGRAEGSLHRRSARVAPHGRVGIRRRSDRGPRRRSGLARRDRAPESRGPCCRRSSSNGAAAADAGVSATSARLRACSRRRSACG